MPGVYRSIKSFLNASVACAMLACGLIGCDGHAQPPVAPPPVKVVSGATPAQADNDRYVGRAVCAQCHQKEHDLWHGSYHDKAMEHATDETVLADFNNSTFTHFKTTSRFFKKDGKFFAHTDGPDGAMMDFEIKFVFGVYPLQQYLVEMPGGRLQTLGAAWDVQQKKWYHMYPDEPIPSTDVLHWTKPLQNWNYMCASCHSTDLKKNFDAKLGAYKTTWFEMNVSCEACHGPGADHVKWARANPPKREEVWPDDWDPKLTNRMKDKDNWTQIQTCAPCHARRRVVAPGHEAGKQFFDHYSLELLTDPLYFPDGQILDEVYVTGSFVQSKMFHRGVRCTNCHEPHSTKLIATGNLLCTNCHGTEKYDTPAHHHHPVESKGASCIECHMPTRTYMGVDVRRDHSFRIPRPDLSVKHGTPNACTQCHEDMSDELAAQAIVELWGAGGPDRKEDSHFTDLFALARKHDVKAAPALARVALDKERAGILRATAVHHLGEMPTPEAAQAIVTALRDSDPQVRLAAVRAMESADPRALPAALSPLLKDEFRMVRVEAARLLTRVALQAFADRSQPESKAFWSALDEFRAGQAELLDQAGTYLNLAVVHENLGEMAEAEQAYLDAIARDASFVPARMNLAMLYAQTNRKAEAEKQLREAVKLWPQSPQPHYSLGLLLGEDPAKLAEAAASLGTAAKLAKTDARMFYNYGLVLQHLRRTAEAEEALVKANELSPDNPDLMQALIAFYGQQNRWREARPLARRMTELLPENEQLKQQYQFIFEKSQQ
ncbi:MAG: ammonia-forming cytochrome c nitrite reductase subunit c552 [Phycisphaeraceae bacterium]